MRTAGSTPFSHLRPRLGDRDRKTRVGGYCFSVFGYGKHQDASQFKFGEAAEKMIGW